MIRSHESVVVYGDDLALSLQSLKRFEEFVRSLTADLAALEARWIHRASPIARSAAQPNSHQRNVAGE